MNHSALWVGVPLVLMLMIYSECERVDKKAVDDKTGSDLWIMGRRDVSNSYKMKF